VASNGLRKVGPNAARAGALIEKARRDLAAVSKIANASEEIAYTAAYEAVFKATLALLALEGLRLGTVEQRKTAVHFLRAVLPKAFDPVLVAYDKMRQRRNDLSYGAGIPVSRTDLDEAAKQAALLIEAIGKIVAPAAGAAKPGKKP